MAQMAIGMIETRGLVALVQGADAALKAADVSYRGWKKVGSGLCTFFVSGDVAAVKAAVEAGVRNAEKVGEVVSSHVIARPHTNIDLVLPLGRLEAAREETGEG